MSWIEALILGIVQGLTEFLPVSSSGHLEIGSVLLRLDTSENLLFAVIVHLATALSTLVVYRSDIKDIAVGFFKRESNESRGFVMRIIISMIPVGIVGFFFQDEVETFFAGNMILVGSMLLVTASLLLFSHYRNSGEGEVTALKAFVVGLAQAIAVLPGISRSGATISTALILGVDREKAARFSFLMVIIPIMGAALLKFWDYLDTAQETTIELSSLIVGFAAAFLSGYIACKWMIKLVTKGKLVFFAAYCGLVGLIVIISQLL